MLEQVAAVRLADLFARGATRCIEDILRNMWSNDDEEKNALSASILAGKQAWLETGTMGVPFTVEQLRPETMEQYFEAKKARPKPAQPEATPLPRSGTE